MHLKHANNDTNILVFTQYVKKKKRYENHVCRQVIHLEPCDGHATIIAPRGRVRREKKKKKMG
jgi:hypothetical protein